MSSCHVFCLVDGIVHVAAISQGSSSTVRGVATYPAVTSAWTAAGGKGADKVRSLEVALAALGAEDTVAKSKLRLSVPGKKRKRYTRISKFVGAPTQFWYMSSAR